MIVEKNVIFNNTGIRIFAFYLSIKNIHNIG